MPGTSQNFAGGERSSLFRNSGQWVAWMKAKTRAYARKHSHSVWVPVTHGLHGSKKPKEAKPAQELAVEGTTVDCACVRFCHAPRLG